MLAWHLQDVLRDEWEVQHFAMAGPGNTHNLIQFLKLKESVTGRDILIFGYAGYYNVRNVAAPSRFSRVVGYTKSKALLLYDSQRRHHSLDWQKPD